MTLVALTLAGAVAGFVASILPGLHVNLLAVALLAVGIGPEGAPFLVAALAASPFGLALSSTFLAGPAEDSALSSLPATQLAREGRAREAVALQAWGALAGILLALPLALLARAVLVPVAPHLARAMPWLLLAVIAALVLTETRKLPVHPERIATPWGTHVEWHEGRLSGLAGKAAALFILLLSGALGLAAFRLGAASPFGWPSSTLLPLLAGLFALPSLVTSLTALPTRVRAVLRTPRLRIGALFGATAPGAAAAVSLGLIPGVSGSHAALLAPNAGTPERSLMRLAAVNGAAVVFTLLAWHALGKARAGALVAAQQVAPVVPWTTWAPSSALLREGAMVVFAALVGCALARVASRGVARVPQRALAWGGLGLLATSVLVFNGWVGLLVLATAGCVGALPAMWGIRRSHAMGVILVPATLRAWGLA